MKGEEEAELERRSSWSGNHITQWLNHKLVQLNHSYIKKIRP